MELLKKIWTIAWKTVVGAIVLYWLIHYIIWVVLTGNYPV